MLRDHDVVCISSIDWDFIWQGHQQIMSTLAERGNRVLFIENTGVRRPRLADLPRLRQRIANWWRSTKGFRRERDNLYVYSPIVLPFPYLRVAQAVNRFILLRAIRRWMRATGFSRPIVWTFLPTGLARGVMRGLEPELAVYYCIDDFASSSGDARRIRDAEIRTFRDVDLVFTTSVKLQERASRFANRVHLFPFAVDYPKFEAARKSEAPAPDDLAAIPRPIVGYLGGVHQWVDQDLLVTVARSLPHVSVVLVGPRQTDTSALAACPNVHLLGARAHDLVPRYIKAFDVGVIPYRHSDYTAHVYPTKLNEYLAMGRPVVATDLAEIVRFNAEHADVVTVAHDAEDFVAGIRRALALAPASDEAIARRIEVARENSWDHRIARMSALIEERLAARRAAPGQWEERLRSLYRTTRRRTLRAVSGLALAYVALFNSPLPWWAASPLLVSAPPSVADAIVVLGSGVGETGKGGESYQERVLGAVELYRGGKAPYMIFSTGWSWTFPEATVMRVLALSLGVPDQAIVLETKAASTHDNAERVDQILRARGSRSILLVTAPYHTRRAVLAFAKTDPGLRVISTPGTSEFYRHRWSANADQLRALGHEYVGIAYYWWRGWI
ncbi:MAG: YdcF family protein [Candidatus Rokubacteria bacterium]|nr:YdcF family protein [Candidatus Rokubacteria bacterium]